MELIEPGSPNLVEGNIDVIAANFPSVITETVDANGEVFRAVDFDLLRQELSDHVVEGPQERYQLDWPGKRKAIVAANSPTRSTLRSMRDESVDFDSTRNLFIEGDNLEALKILQESYLGKVKLIYIDPPYNTGSDFIYNDDYAQSAAEYLERSGQQDESGARLVANTESNGRFHSDWLSMMLPRLKLARNLLRDDGVLFVSIGDDEVHNLKSVLDEVFGSQNFVATIIWQKVYSPMNSATQFASVHDYLHVYARDAASWTSNLLPRTAEQDAAYKNPDNDPRGRWKAADATAAAGHATPSQFYELVTPAGLRFNPPPGRAWVYTEPRFAEMLADGRIWFGTDGRARPAIKRFLSEVKQGRVAESFWPYQEAGHNQDAKKELLALLQSEGAGRVFDTPKPTKLVRRILQVATSASDDIVLDFFAGSGTTGDAVLQQNAEDGGSRRFILVQLAAGAPSGTTEGEGIAELARERLRRAGDKVKDSAGLEAVSQDIGFRALRIDSGSWVEVLNTPDETQQTELTLLAENIKPDRVDEDLVFQVMVDWGLDYSLPLVKESIRGCDVYSIDSGALVACFAKQVPTEVISEIARMQPLRVAFLDSSFETDSQRINVEQIFRELSPDTQVKVI